MRSAQSRVVKAEWTLDYPGYRSNVATPEVRAITQAMTRALGQPVVQSVSLGGSVPMAEISRVLGVPIVNLSFANYDNNQHAANENLRLGSLWDGVRLYEALLSDVR